LAIAVLLLAVAAWAVNIKLYLKDGTFNMVREYQVKDDRVRYYSVERSDWEEMPLDLVDLKRTESEAAARKAQLDEQAKSQAEEDTASRELKKEISRIPMDPGVYWLDGKDTKSMKLASSTMHTDKRREALKIFTPVGPALSSKGILELDGAHAATVFTDPEPEFFIVLSETERFGIAKLSVKNGLRIIENVTFLPTKEIEEEPLTMVDIFRQQLASDELYKIWPKEPMEPGEYAVVQYTEGKLDIQVWDFAIARK
jgi:hypothetical protein